MHLLNLLTLQGFVQYQRGPSILDLGDIAGAGLQSSAAFFSLGAGGYLAGCLAAGLTFDRFYRQMFLFWPMLGLCATTAVLPWCVPYSAMAAVYFSGFAFIGSLETGKLAQGKRLEVKLRGWARGFLIKLKGLQVTVCNFLSYSEQERKLQSKPHLNPRLMPIRKKYPKM